jgi:hypothetical protein
MVSRHPGRTGILRVGHDAVEGMLKTVGRDVGSLSEDVEEDVLFGFSRV